MIAIECCAEKDIVALAKAIGKAALGKSVQFVVEEGVHRIVDEGRLFETLNGTLTLRLFVNGGARDSGVPRPLQIREDGSVVASIGQDAEAGVVDG